MVDTSVPHTWYVYIIEASDNSLYTGVATDVERRFQQHLNGKGAKFFNKGRQPVRVVYQEGLALRSEALVREAAIKRLSRAQKLALTSLPK